MGIDKNLAAALVKAQAKLENIAKKSTAGAGNFKYFYAELPDVCDFIRPILAECALAFSHTVERIGENDNRMVCTLIHESGAYTESCCPLVGPYMADMQKLGSAMTYGRRYTLLAVLGLATEDDDGKQASEPPKGERSPSKAQGGQSNSSLPKYDNLSEKQVKRLYAIAKKHKWGKEEIKGFCEITQGVHPTKMSKEQYDELCTYMEENPQEAN